MKTTRMTKLKQKKIWNRKVNVRKLTFLDSDDEPLDLNSNPEDNRKRLKRGEKDKDKHSFHRQIWPRFNSGCSLRELATLWLEGKRGTESDGDAGTPQEEQSCSHW